MKTLLNVGCGWSNISQLKGFNNDNWKEIRFDIDKNVNPDIEGTLTDMSLVETGSVDALYSTHNIEHIYPHEVRIALKEFYRVINEDGFAYFNSSISFIENIKMLKYNCCLLF